MAPLHVHTPKSRILVLLPVDWNAKRHYIKLCVWQTKYGFFSLLSCLFQPNLRVPHLLLMQWHLFNLQYYLWPCHWTGTRQLSWNYLFTWRSCMSHSCYLCDMLHLNSNLENSLLLFLSICKNLLFGFGVFLLFFFFAGEGGCVWVFKIIFIYWIRM